MIQIKIIETERWNLIEGEIIKIRAKAILISDNCSLPVDMILLPCNTKSHGNWYKQIRLTKEVKCQKKYYLNFFSKKCLLKLENPAKVFLYFSGSFLSSEKHIFPAHFFPMKNIFSLLISFQWIAYFYLNHESSDNHKFLIWSNDNHYDSINLSFRDNFTVNNLVKGV